MLFELFRPAGEACWQDTNGKTLYGWAGLVKVGTVEAGSAEEAFDAARSVRDPSPILLPVEG